MDVKNLDPNSRERNEIQVSSEYPSNQIEPTSIISKDPTKPRGTQYRVAMTSGTKSTTRHLMHGSIEGTVGQKSFAPAT